MHTYKWKSSYNVGFSSIDDQHKNLLASINRLLVFQGADKQKVVLLIDEVIKYAEFHFLSEENLMRLSHYPDLENHTHQHRVLLRQIKNHRANIQHGATGLHETLTFLTEWLVNHIVKEDIGVAEHLRRVMPQLEQQIAV